VISCEAALRDGLNDGKQIVTAVLKLTKYGLLKLLGCKIRVRG
jgi:hypothetical protein